MAGRRHHRHALWHRQPGSQGSDRVGRGPLRRPRLRLPRPPRDLVKLLWSDGDGMCLLTKRLERGRFVWPQADTGSVALSAAQLSMLLEGIDWRRPERTWQPRAAA